MKCQTHEQDVCISTGIHGGLTFGHGNLCNNGFWDVICWEGEALHRRKEVEELEAKALSRQNAVHCVEGLMLFEDHRAKGLTLIDVVGLRLKLTDQFKLTNDDFLI